MQVTTIYKRLRFLPSIVLLLAALAVTSAHAQAPEQTLTPQDDSFTHAGAPNANFGSRAFMRAASSSTGERTSFVDFNWSLVTDNVSSATLRLFVDRVRKDGTVQISPVLGNWFESGIRFNNQPNIGPSEASSAITEDGEGRYIEIDVTSIVLAFQSNMPPPNGFALASDGNVDVSFATAESANPPQLVLTTGGGTVNTAPVVAILAPADGSSFVEGGSILFAGMATDAEDGSLSGSLNWTSNIDGALASGDSFSTTTLSLGAHTITAAATDSGGMTGTSTITVSVNAAGGLMTETRRIQDDSFTSEGAPSANFSRRKFMRVAVSSSGERISFVEPHLVGLSRNVVSAQLRFFVDDVKRGGTLQVSTVGENWFELGIKWNNQPVINPPVTSIPITSADEGDYLEIDVTSIIQGYQVNMPPPFGMAFRSADGLDVSFATKESANPPQLVVTTDGGPINTAPTVTATVLQSGQLEGDPITFTGTATDDLDGDLSSSLSWSSNLDGFIGFGASFTTTTLSAGTHTVTASVTDSGGLTGNRTLVFGVLPVGSGSPEFRRVLNDSFTHEGAPKANFSARRTMRVANSSSGERISFLRPDLTGVTRPVTSAVLKLIVDDFRRGGTVEVSAVGGNWEETTITWNNQPFIAPPATSTEITVAEAGDIVNIDVTSIIQQSQTNPPFFGVALRSADGLDITFLTDERDRDSGGLFLYYD